MVAIGHEGLTTAAESLRLMGTPNAGAAAAPTPWFSHALVGLEVGPAVLLNLVGKGTVLTIAGSPDFATAGEHHIVETRKLFANAVRLLSPTPRVRITAPANVEACFSKASRVSSRLGTCGAAGSER